MYPNILGDLHWNPEPPCREGGVEDERKERGREAEREGHPEPREGGAGEVG
jgi:hypothetical protein